MPSREPTILAPRLLAGACLLSLATTLAAAEPSRYELDPVHTRVMFAVEHAGFSHAIGTVSGTTGTLVFDPDDWRSARLEASVPLARIDLGDADWNRAALAGNLLDVDDYPVATFVSTRAEPVGADPAPVEAVPTVVDANASTSTRADADAGAGDGEAAAAAAAAAATETGTETGDAQADADVDVDASSVDAARICGDLTLHGVTREVCLDVTMNALKRHPMPPFRRTAGFSATTQLSRKAFGIDAWPSVIGDTVELRIEAEAIRKGRVSEEALNEIPPPPEVPAAPPDAPDAPAADPVPLPQPAPQSESRPVSEPVETP